MLIFKAVMQMIGATQSSFMDYHQTPPSTCTLTQPCKQSKFITFIIFFISNTVNLIFFSLKIFHIYLTFDSTNAVSFWPKFIMTLEINKLFFILTNHNLVLRTFLTPKSTCMYYIIYIL